MNRDLRNRNSNFDLSHSWQCLNHDLRNRKSNLNLSHSWQCLNHDLWNRNSNQRAAADVAQCRFSDITTQAKESKRKTRHWRYLQEFWTIPIAIKIMFYDKLSLMLSHLIWSRWKVSISWTLERILDSERSIDNFYIDFYPC